MLLFATALLGASLINQVAQATPEITPEATPNPSSSLITLAPGQWPPDIAVDHWEDDTIYFKVPDGYPTPSPLKTQLKNLQIIGLLTPATSNIPYLLVAADTPDGNCAKCSPQPQTLFLMRGDSQYRSTFPLPGKVWDKKSGRTLVQSRAFFGTCLTDRSVVYIAFQDETIDRKRRRSRIEKSVFVGELTPTGMNERLVSRRLPNIKNVLRRVKKGLCTEIPGKQRATVNFDLRLPYQNRATPSPQPSP